MDSNKPQVTPTRILDSFVRGWWILLSAAIVGGVLAFGYSALQSPVFQSTASTYFSMRSGSSGSDINQGSTYTQNQMLSFAQLATSSIVLDKVRTDLPQDLSAQQLRRMTTVSIPQNTVILDVTAASTDRQLAAEVANGIAAELARAVDDIAPKDAVGKATVVARVIEPAVPAEFQTSPNKQRDAILGAMAGALLAALVLAVWALLDTRVRNEGVLRRITEVPVVGAIPLRKDRGRNLGPVVVSEPNGSTAEAYRALRSSLRFAAVEHDIKAIAVTSSIPGEGKTTTSIDLALTYAEAGLTTLLVDADLRRPRVAEVLDLENSVGLTTMLVGAVDFDEAKQFWEAGRLWVLTAGAVPPNPAELLASARMRETLTALRGQFDVMVVDTGPLLSVADATIIATIVDTTIVVVDTTRVRLAQVDRALGSLDSVRASIAGVLFTRVKRERGDSYQYYGPEEGGRRQARPGRGLRGHSGDASGMAESSAGRAESDSDERAEDVVLEEEVHSEAPTETAR